MKACLRSGNKKIRPKQIILLGAIVVLFSRIPFLNNGYGNDPDAWEVARAAREIAQMGQYSASRLPGYPLQEFSYSLIWNTGPFGFNLVSASLSTLCFVLFALILKQIKSKNFLIGALALAFTPVIYVNSTNSMDYIWALTFILGSTYLILIKRPFVAGIFLGLAIGCRITSVVMVVPLSLTQISQDGKFVSRRIILLWFSACLVGGMTFAPVFGRYGLNFFTFYQGEYPEILKVVYKISIGVWGVFGSMAVMLAVFFILRNSPWKQLRKNVPETDSLLVFSWALVIVIYSILYFRLPYEAGYLIPIVPFVLLICDRFLDGKRFVLVCMLLILSSFIVTVDKSGISLSGPVFSDYTERQQTAKLIDDVFSFDKKSISPTVIIAGYYLPIIEISLYDHTPIVQSSFVDVLDNKQIMKYQNDGYVLYYLPKMREYNIYVTGVDPEDYNILQLGKASN